MISFRSSFIIQKVIHARKKESPCRLSSLTLRGHLAEYRFDDGPKQRDQEVRDHSDNNRKDRERHEAHNFLAKRLDFIKH